jgi:arsenical pump membrane protein
LLASLSHTWQPFVLVTGLLLIGHVASNDGLFAWVGQLVARTPGNDVALFAVTMVAVALVTAVLNLDTSVVFMTPVALHAARGRDADEVAFAYGTILMSNAASLLLVGSNLTNMLIFANRPVRGTVFAGHMITAWLACVVVTIVIVSLWRRGPLRHRAPAQSEGDHFRPGFGTAAVAVAVAAMLLLSQPALIVIIAGALVELADLSRRHWSTWRDTVDVASPYVVGPLFVVAVLVGWLGRVWHSVGHVIVHADALATALYAAALSLVINNLPAASLFAGQPVAHPYALLLGLDLGPNAFVTGAMSTLLWFRITRRDGFTPRLRSFVGIGLPVTVVSLVVASFLL